MSKKKIAKKVIVGAVIVVLIAVIAVLATLVFKSKNDKKNEARIITETTLEKIINISDLSTYKAIYNGVTSVANKEDASKTDYYVSYEAEVKAGFDFDDIKVNVDDEIKRIEITIPEIKIIDINVSAQTMDFIFINKKADDEDVAQEAYKVCREDVMEESKNEKDIYNLARQNAINVIKALTQPFIEQLDDDYKLIIK